MLADKLICLNLRLRDYLISLCLCISKDSLLVADNLLVSLDLLRRLCTKLRKQLLKLFTIDKDLVS